MTWVIRQSKMILKEKKRQNNSFIFLKCFMRDIVMSHGGQMIMGMGIHAYGYMH